MRSVQEITRIFKSGSDAAFAALIVLFGISLALNVRFGILIRSNGLLETHQQTELSSTAEATIGGKPELSHLIDINGKAAKIDASKTTLIYYFSPSCSWCKLNLPGISSLAKQVALRPDYEIIGMTQNSSGLKEYLVQHPLPFRVVIDNDPYDISTMDLRGTPQTIMIDKGEVVHNWSGAYHLKVKDSIQSALGISLPDLYAAKQPEDPQKRSKGGL